MYRYSFTFSSATEESSLEGDSAEHGYYMPGGWFYPIPPGCVGSDFLRWREDTGPFDHTIDETDIESEIEDLWEQDGPAPEAVWSEAVCRVMAEIIRSELGTGGEWSSSEPVSAGDWYSVIDEDVYTDTTEDGDPILSRTLSIHLAGFSDAQVRRIAELLRA